MTISWTLRVSSQEALVCSRVAFLQRRDMGLRTNQPVYNNGEDVRDVALEHPIPLAEKKKCITLGSGALRCCAREGCGICFSRRRQRDFPPVPKAPPLINTPCRRPKQRGETKYTLPLCPLDVHLHECAHNMWVLLCS